MQYAFYGLDKPGGIEIRTANRDAHVAHLRRHIDNIVMAGPLLSEDGATMIGSLIVVDFADKARGDGVLAADPYAKAGLFESVEVRPWRKTLP